MVWLVGFFVVCVFGFVFFFLGVGWVDNVEKRESRIKEREK